MRDRAASGFSCCRQREAWEKLFSPDNKRRGNRILGCKFGKSLLYEVVHHKRALLTAAATAEKFCPLLTSRTSTQEELAMRLRFLDTEVWGYYGIMISLLQFPCRSHSIGFRINFSVLSDYAESFCYRRNAKNKMTGSRGAPKNKPTW